MELEYHLLTKMGLFVEFLYGVYGLWSYGAQSKKILGHKSSYEFASQNSWEFVPKKEIPAKARLAEAGPGQFCVLECKPCL